MKPIDPSEFEDSEAPTSFEAQVKLLYGDSALALKTPNLKVALGVVAVGAVVVWGGGVWLAAWMLIHHH
jgi:hypothetical protein